MSRIDGRAADEVVPEEVPEGNDAPAAGRLKGSVIYSARSFGRMIWRQLTSMRTALILLFLLAVGSLPAALLPQWYLNEAKTLQYIADHPTWGRLLNSLGFFDVIASPWYAAIYLLLAISLVGCITPRSIELVAQWRAKPGRAPRNLARLPHHAEVAAPGAPDAVAERIRGRLRRTGIGGWRVVVRQEADGAVSVSAERGYLREIGNLTFHVAILGLLFTMAIGSMFGYKGSKLVTDGEGFCSSAPVSYDNFDPGRMVDGTAMTPFCVQVDAFQAGYDDAGRALYYRAQLQVQTGADAGSDRWSPHLLNINDPLRISGQRLYLLGHGYVPQFQVTYPDGELREYSAPFEPQDAMFTSEGAVKITDPPGYAADTVREHQLAIVGIFAPSGLVSGGILTSGYPQMLAPAVAVEIYRGDLGLDHGAPQSIFAIDNDQVDKGLLVSQGRANLNLGESMTLDDGTVITFTGAREFVSLQTSYDPVQGWALVFALLLVGGILTSLTIKRRRVFYRVIADADGICRVQVGGLARTDQAGYGAEFDSLVLLVGEDAPRGGDGAPRAGDGAPRDEKEET